MKLVTEQLRALSALQELDLNIVRMKKQVDELSEKQEILLVRQKRAAILPKKKAVLVMKDNALTHVTSLEDDISNINRLIDAAQEKVEASQMDFRHAEVAARELEGHREHLLKLEDDLINSQKRLADANNLWGQVVSALGTLDAKECQLIAQYREKGGKLLAQIAAWEAQRPELEAQIPADVLKKYNRLLQSKGGVALTRVVDDACVACRRDIDEVHMAQLRGEAPLSVCPHCGRLIIVE